MSFPEIQVGSLSASGLAWLFITYGYTLFFASSLISEGSDLLLLVPAYAGIVGSCVLPVLGAVPDGAIMLFSGMGDIEEAQEQLAVGVGALAGSTIMLLTIPWSLAGFAGCVDLDDQGRAKYGKRPKLTKPYKLSECGVMPGRQVRMGAIAMMLTTISYLVIQGPAFALEMSGNAESASAVAAGEKWFALLGLCTTILGFVLYLAYQVATSGSEHDMKKLKADAIIKRKVQRGELSLAGAMAEIVMRETPQEIELTAYQAVPSAETKPVRNTRLSEIIRPFFNKIDKDSSGSIDEKEASVLLDQLGNKAASDADAKELFSAFDKDNSGTIDFDEFVLGVAKKLREQYDDARGSRDVADVEHQPTTEEEEEEESEEEEEDEIPEDLSHLPPAKQQYIIKRRALAKLALGTVLVLVFSDPMVDVMAEMGTRTGIPPFYISFVLAPLASNASELLASYYYALKKTSKTITISFAALEGAACMNNTFCLAIFMGLVYFRGIAWQYSAETLSILLVQFLIAIIACKSVQTLSDSLVVLAIYPFSIAFVYFLENVVGLD